MLAKQNFMVHKHGYFKIIPMFHASQISSEILMISNSQEILSISAMIGRREAWKLIVSYNTSVDVTVALALAEWIAIKVNEQYPVKQPLVAQLSLQLRHVN